MQVRQRKTGFVALVVFMGSFALSPGVAAKADGETQVFVVKEGYLSASIRQLVYEYEWALVWESAEDRVIDRPFHITNPSLEVALSSLLAMYKGTFVADMYRGNRVVQVTTPSPGVYVNLPADMVAEEPQPEAMTEEGQENMGEVVLAKPSSEDSEEQAALDEAGAEDTEEQAMLDETGAEDTEEQAMLDETGAEDTEEQAALEDSASRDQPTFHPPFREGVEPSPAEKARIVRMLDVPPLLFEEDADEPSPTEEALTMQMLDLLPAWEGEDSGATPVSVEEEPTPGDTIEETAKITQSDETLPSKPAPGVTEEVLTVQMFDLSSAWKDAEAESKSLLDADTASPNMGPFPRPGLLTDEATKASQFATGSWSGVLLAKAQRIGFEVPEWEIGSAGPPAVLQILASQNRGKAETDLARLQALDYDAYLQEFRQGDILWYRLQMRVSPGQSIESVKADLTALGYGAVWVVSQDFARESRASLEGNRQLTLQENPESPAPEPDSL